MQTFLPHADFVRSAQSLDRQRLGKQRVECVQIMRALIDPEVSGWRNHPATKMWQGYEAALYYYMEACCDEWVARGYNNQKCGEWLSTFHEQLLRDGYFRESVEPWWFGTHKFHQAHRLKLLWKLPEHYSTVFDESVPTDEPPYWWPNMDSDDYSFTRG